MFWTVEKDVQNISQIRKCDQNDSHMIFSPYAIYYSFKLVIP